MEFGFSDYFIIGEFISCWGSFLICINTMLSYALYDKRQRMFLYAAGATLLASLFNIFSVRCIADFSPETIGICVFSTTLYFLVLLICPFVMSAYVCDMAFNHPKKKFIFYSVGGVVQIIYMIIVLVNIRTGWIFYYDEAAGYTRGPFKYITYILSAAYGFSIVVMVLIQRKYLARRIFLVFMIYPFISLAFVAVQFIYPRILLTGVASFTSVLFAYMTIQSYTMEVNLATGLMNESRLRKRIVSQRSGGVLYVMTIDNITMIQSCLDVAETSD